MPKVVVTPRLSWQRVFLRLYLRWVKARTDRVHFTVERQRRDFEKSTALMRVPANITVDKTMIDNVAADWLALSNSPSDAVILYLHGGGYMMGSCKTHRAFAAHVATACKINTLLLDYRLAPEHPFPAAIEDAVNAYRHLQSRGYTKIFFVGDSASGGLALATILQLLANDEKLPAACVCLSPLTDLTGSGETLQTRLHADPMNKPEDKFIFSYYVGKHDLRLPLISPLFGNLLGFPPLFIQVGNDEIMLSDATRFAEKAELAGVQVNLEIWQGMWHIFQFFTPLLPEAKLAIGHIADFMNSTLNGRPITSMNEF